MIKRHITKVIKEYANDFPAILLTGLRQVGKSFIFNEEFSKINYYTLDDIVFLEQLKKDVRGVVDSIGVPVVIDEIQKNTELFVTLKYFIDKNRKNGMYYLTGSQKYLLMKGITESLAGRIGIINMMGLSNREISKDNYSEPFIPTKKYLGNRKPKELTKQNVLWNRIFKGSFPEVYANKTIDVTRYMASFIQSYVERDVRLLSQVEDYDSFNRLIIILASRIGQILNIASISRDLGIDVRTTKKYISILEAANVIYFIKSFSTNLSTRVIKSPKLYFTDTGLACYLTKWPTADVLSTGAMSGNFYENHIINEIVKSYINKGLEPPLYYYRDVDDKEIDLIITKYSNNKTIIHPIEIKQTASPNIKDIKGFIALNNMKSVEIGEGGIICNYDKVMYLDKKNWIIPWNYI